MPLSLFFSLFRFFAIAYAYGVALCLSSIFFIVLSPLLLLLFLCYADASAAAFLYYGLFFRLRYASLPRRYAS